MLSGDSSILQKTTEAKMETEKSQIIENAQVDVLGQQTENNGTNITKKQLATILNKYFKAVKENDIPDEISNSSDIELTTKDEKYKIMLSKIYSGNLYISKWVYDHTTQRVTKDNQSFQIGDYIKYDAPENTGYTGVKKWRLLGEENGQILLISTDAVYSETNKGSRYPGIKLSGDSSGLENAINELNRIGSLYMSPETADQGRSVNVNDINRITGYNALNCYSDPNDLTKIGPCGDGSTKYGTIVTYSIKNGKVWYKFNDGTNIIERETNDSDFMLPGNSKNITEDTPLQASSFIYYAQTLGSFEESAVASSDREKLNGLKSDSKEYDCLFNFNGGSDYWLATQYVNTNSRPTWSLYRATMSGRVYGTNERCILEF